MEYRYDDVTLTIIEHNGILVATWDKRENNIHKITEELISNIEILDEL